MTNGKEPSKPRSRLLLPEQMRDNARSMTRTCVFCGSHDGTPSTYFAAAEALGRALAASGSGLVYGGSHTGLMGALADAVLAGGAEVIGVIPEHLVAREVAHRGLTELRVVRTMHERKAVMSELADAFVVLPGGLGTLEEFFEVLTWSQLGLHAKPAALLNVGGFYDPLLALLANGVRDGFVYPTYRDRLVVDTDAARLVERLAELVG
jgi:uncharacterized protein (TIGR00730 family)